jgi:mRNA-degrading endonuclease RelE of RelBE toxin-antitoxin system
MSYPIRFTPTAGAQFRALRKYDQVRIRDAMVRQLTDKPDEETRHKKRIDSDLLSTHELRVGDFRVFYDIDVDKMEVVIEAIGIKRHNRLFIEGEEVEL